MTDDRAGPLLLVLWMLSALLCAPINKERTIMSETAGAAITIGVCPHCEKSTRHYAFMTRDGHVIESHCCKEHGDVIPARKPVTFRIGRRHER